MSIPEFDTAQVLEEAEAVFEDTKQLYVPISTEFPFITAQSVFQIVQREYNHTISRLDGKVDETVEVLRLLENKFTLPSFAVEPAEASIIIDVTAADIDTINSIILDHSVCEAECEMFQVFHEVNLAFVEAGGAIRPKYAIFSVDDSDAA